MAAAVPSASHHVGFTEPVRLVLELPAGHHQDDAHGDEQHKAYGQSRDWRAAELDLGCCQACLAAEGGPGGEEEGRQMGGGLLTGGRGSPSGGWAADGRPCIRLAHETSCDENRDGNQSVFY